MTRRTRRRVYVVVLAALIGAGSPVWAPPLLQALPAFRVERVEVVGTRFVAPDAVAARADVPPSASVWDEPNRWSRRVEAMTLVERARVRRSGFHTLEITVEEVDPVALAAAGGILRAVSADGSVLPLDPAEHGLDLPVLLVGDSVASRGRLRGREPRRLLSVLGRLREEDGAFVDNISSLRLLRGGGVEVRMLESTHARTVLLPPERPARALRRIELALGEQGDDVATADARFRSQVVLDGTGGGG